MDTTRKRASFNGKLSYVLATAGSAVGLGNIWRFPFLAAKYGGGIFLLFYILFSVICGYALIVAETSLGRMTRKSPIGAFKLFGRKPFFRVGGWLNAIVPMIIVPYYCVIGGWLLKYLIDYITGRGAMLSQDGYFGSFISNSAGVEVFFLIYLFINLIIIFCGVEKGIAKVSKVLMPSLLLLGIFVMIYSLTRPGAVNGVKYLFVPDFKNFSINTVVQAMGQMFYSLSIGMGILCTYGSYMEKDIDIEKSTVQVQIFDSGVALLGGLMIIPAVFSYSNGSLETLQAGPSLAFVMLPKIFNSMGGAFGIIVAIAFFFMFAFAAITSSISLLETCVSTVQDETKLSRRSSILAVGIGTIYLGTLSAYGYGYWANVNLFGLQFLDFFDTLANNILLPISALCIVVLVAYIIKTSKVEEEVCVSSEFKSRKLFEYSLKFVCPIVIAIVFISSIISLIPKH